MRPTLTVVRGGIEDSPWLILERALSERRPVQAIYHGRPRRLCPHLLGWTNGRALVLCYQAGGAGQDLPGPLKGAGG